MTKSITVAQLEAKLAQWVIRGSRGVGFTAYSRDNGVVIGTRVPTFKLAKARLYEQALAELLNLSVHEPIITSCVLFGELNKEVTVRYVNSCLGGGLC